MATGLKQEKAKYRNVQESSGALHRRHFSRLRLVFTPSEGALVLTLPGDWQNHPEPEKTCGFKEHVDGSQCFLQSSKDLNNNTQTCSRGCPKPSPITYFPRKWVNICCILSKWIRLIPASSATERRSQERSLLSTARNKQTHSHLKLREQDRIKKRREWWEKKTYFYDNQNVHFSQNAETTHASL